MGTKSIRLNEDVYERVKARKRDEETFSETIDRLIGGPSLLELSGVLTDEQSDEFREAIRESHAAHDREIVRMLDQER